MTRISVSNDLVADETVYNNRAAMSRFSTMNPSTKKLLVVQKTLPCKVYLIACARSLKKNCITMLEDAKAEDVYSAKRINQKLIERYKGYIFFAEVCGRKNVVLFSEYGQLDYH